MQNNKLFRELALAVFSTQGHLSRKTKMAGPFGLREYLVLMVLADKGSMRPGDLAVHAGLSATSLTPTVDRLESKGWLERSKDPTDRRAILVTITEKGIDALSQMPDLDAFITEHANESDIEQAIETLSMIRL